MKSDPRILAETIGVELPEALPWRKPVRRMEPASTEDCKGEREGEEEEAQRSNSDWIIGARGQRCLIPFLFFSVL